jgi:RHS repeat-associated protein
MRLLEDHMPSANCVLFCTLVPFSSFSSLARRACLALIAAGCLFYFSRPVEAQIKTTHPREATATAPDVPAQVELSPPPPMRYVPGMEEPLVATGPVSEQENEDLDAALAAFHDAPAKAGQAGDYDDYAKPLLAFVDAHPASNWNASLYLNIGLGFYQSGYYSRTFTYFEKSWQLGRDATSIQAKRMADRAMGELAEMHARLGHAEELKTFFTEIGDRPVSGSASFMMEGAHEGLESFDHRPEIAYLCGPAALRNMLLWLKASPGQVEVADDARSGPHGFSLSQLAALADKAGLKYRLIYRKPGQPVPVPSIINWNVHHYAAILDGHDGHYRLQDPTFGAAGSVVTEKAADEEGSGYFLVPAKVLESHSNSGWRIVAANSAEANSVYGMGNTFNALPGCVTCNDKTTKPANGQQMTLASARMAKASLSLSDTPVGYKPQKGLPALVSLTYNARDGDQPANFSFSNLSPLWAHNWQSYVQDDPNNPGSKVKRIVGQGGGYDYDVLSQLSQTVYNSSTGAFVAETYDNSHLVRIPATGAATSYVRTLPDGSQETFGLSNGAASAPRIMFLTAVTDPAGNTTTLDYDGQFRLTSLTDAMGRKTIFTYGLTGFPLLITKITDPFGRSSKLTYDTSARLSSITDPIGITSLFTYGSMSEPNFVTALTTPYGTSKFSDALDPGVPRTSYLELSLAMTDPLGNVEYLHVYQNQSITGTGPEAAVPAGMTNDNPYLMWRNTYYWNAHEAANGGVTTDANGNPTGEKFTNPDIYHWFHQCCTINYLSSQLGSHKRPLEKYREWYNTNPIYNTGYYSGTFDGPIATGRVLDDGTTQLAKATYNGLGLPLTNVDPIGRAKQFTYAPNNIDLQTVQQLTAAPSTYSTIATFGNYNSQHEPQTYTGADGQVWNYSYNTAGQLSTITDPNNGITTYNYDSLGRLSTVQNANLKTALTLTYDSADRVETRTDSEGYTLTYTYDKLDRVTKITYPDSTNDVYDYKFLSGPNAGKASLELRKHIDRLGRVTTYNYDADRRLISVTEPGAITTTYDYYEDGTLRDITDAKGNVTHWEIDLQSRPTSKTYAFGTANPQTETYAYEVTSSRLHSITDALGQVKTFTYGHDDRITGITYTNAVNATPNVTLAWDPFFPRLSSMADGLGTTNYAYTPIGSLGALKLASIDGPFNNDVIGLTYDAPGRLAGRNIAGGNETFGYDPIWRMTAHATPLGSFTYGYLGQTDQTASRSVTNGATTVSTGWGYDTNVNDRRLITIANSGVTRSYTLGYTSGGVTNPYDILSITDNAAAGHPFASQSHSYTYDKIDRLLTATATVPGNDAYVYDKLDNPTKVTRPSGTVRATYNDLNQIDTWGAKSYSYDADGNTLSGDGKRTYKWDAENRLVEIDHVGSNAKSQFSYDGLGHRTVDVDTSARGSTTTTRYLWCGSMICQTRDGSDNVLRRDLDEGEFNVATGEKLGYMPDQLGSVRDVLDATTGSLVDARDYSPYGSIARSNGTTPTDYDFAGLFYHPKSGLNLSATRPMDGVTGRWLGRDPIREAGGINLYEYAGQNPVEKIDPSGLTLYSISGGFDLPVGPWVATGPSGLGLNIYDTTNLNGWLFTYQPPTQQLEIGGTADIGFNFSASDFSGTGGQCAGITMSVGWSKYLGASVILRSTQDLSLPWYDLYRYIDGISINVGLALPPPLGSPITISGPLYVPNGAPLFPPAPTPVSTPQSAPLFAPHN